MSTEFFLHRNSDERARNSWLSREQVARVGDEQKNKMEMKTSVGKGRRRHCGSELIVVEGEETKGYVIGEETSFLN